MSTVAKPFYTFEQYLALERAQEYRSEYFAGEIFAMAGGTENHSLVASNVNRILGQQLRDRPCKVYTGDMRIKVQATGLTTYPDISSLCGKAEFLDELHDTLLNPQLIVEVLSPSTESYDRGKKFEHYRKIESLQDYVLISQDRMLVECFTRDSDGSWSMRDASAAGQSIRLSSLDCDLPLDEVYAKVEFTQPQP